MRIILLGAPGAGKGTKLNTSWSCLLFRKSQRVICSETLLKKVQNWGLR